MKRLYLLYISLISFLIAIAIILFFCSQYAFAGGAMYNYTHDFFTHYNPDVTSDYVYDEEDTTTDLAGAYGCGSMPYKTIQISIPVLQSTSISVRIEGQIEDANTWADIYTKSYTSATSIDDSVMVTEHLHNIRVGLKATGEATTDSVTVRGHFGVLKTR